jgi:hypothetical protein
MHEKSELTEEPVKQPMTREHARKVLAEYPDADLSAFHITDDQGVEQDVEVLAAEAAGGSIAKLTRQVRDQIDADEAASVGPRVRPWFPKPAPDLDACEERYAMASSYMTQPKTLRAALLACVAARKSAQDVPALVAELREFRRLRAARAALAEERAMTMTLDEVRKMAAERGVLGPDVEEHPDTPEANHRECYCRLCLSYMS